VQSLKTDHQRLDKKLVNILPDAESELAALVAGFPAVPHGINANQTRVSAEHLQLLHKSNGYVVFDGTRGEINRFEDKGGAPEDFELDTGASAQDEGADLGVIGESQSGAILVRARHSSGEPAIYMLPGLGAAPRLFPLKYFSSRMNLPKTMSKPELIVLGDAVVAIALDERRDHSQTFVFVLDPSGKSSEPFRVIPEGWDFHYLAYIDGHFITAKSTSSQFGTYLTSEDEFESYDVRNGTEQVRNVPLRIALRDNNDVVNCKLPDSNQPCMWQQVVTSDTNSFLILGSSSAGTYRQRLLKDYERVILIDVKDGRTEFIDASKGVGACEGSLKPLPMSAVTDVFYVGRVGQITIGYVRDSEVQLVRINNNDGKRSAECIGTLYAPFRASQWSSGDNKGFLFAASRSIVMEWHDIDQLKAAPRQILEKHRMDAQGGYLLQAACDVGLAAHDISTTELERITGLDTEIRELCGREKSITH
jgi:hypothetical protein